MRKNETHYLSWDKPLELQGGNPIWKDKRVMVPPSSTSFPLGQVVITVGVQTWLREKDSKQRFANTIFDCLNKHSLGDWGESLDKEQNDIALRTGRDSMISVWTVGKEKVWIWTEHDRSATTILFPDER